MCYKSVYRAGEVEVGIKEFLTVNSTLFIGLANLTWLPAVHYNDILAVIDTTLTGVTAAGTSVRQ